MKYLIAVVAVLLFCCGCMHHVKVEKILPFDSMTDDGYRQLVENQAALLGIVIPGDPDDPKRVLPTWYPQLQQSIGAYNLAQDLWNAHLSARKLNSQIGYTHERFILALRQAAREFAALQQMRGIHP